MCKRFEKALRPSWPISGKSERLPMAVRWQYQRPTLQLRAAQVVDAQSWIALFRAFSSHQQPSAKLNQRHSPATSLPNWANLNGLHRGRSFIGNNFYNENGSDFQGVGHEGRQAFSF